MDISIYDSLNISESTTPHIGADRYWVGGTGNWDASTTTHWAASSGGSGGETVPMNIDNVYFDLHGNEATDATYTVTKNAAGVCLNLDVSFTGTTKVVLAGSSSLGIYGSLNFSGGTAQITNNFTGNITFYKPSGTATISTNAVPLKSNVTFNGAGGTFQLSDNLEIAGSYKGITLTNGSFDANAKNVLLSTTGTATIIGAFTFYNLSRIPYTSSSLPSLSLYSNITVTNTLTLTGSASPYRLLVSSTASGTARTITAAAVTASYVDLSDIVGAGAATWDLSAITGRSGNVGGNSLKALGDSAFTAAATQHWTNVNGGYWTGSGNWTSRVPLPQDDVYMDCAFGTSKTVYGDFIIYGKSIDWSGATWTTQLTWDRRAGSFNGSLILVSGFSMSNSDDLVLTGRGNYVFDSAGKTISGRISLQAPGGVYKLANNLTMGTAAGVSLSLDYGELTAINGANNYIISVGSIENSATLTLGSATHLLTGLGSGNRVIQNSGTINPGTGTIKITDTSNTAITFYVTGTTNFNNLWISRGASTGTVTFNSANTYADLKDDGTAGHTIVFPNSTTTVSSLSVNGTAGNLISLTRTGTTGTWSISDSSGINNCNYLNISNSTATGGAQFIANSSIDSGGNTGWDFSLNASIAETLSISEDVQVILVNLINVYDTLNISESKTLTVELKGVSVFDSISISENITLTVQLEGINSNESLSVSEDVVVTNSQLGDISKLENLNVSEDVITTNSQLGDISKVETLNISEDVIITNSQLGDISKFETLNIRELNLLSFGLLLDEELQISEEVTIENPQLGDISIIDDINISENFTDVLRGDINIYDSINVSENTTVDALLGDINIYNSLDISEEVVITNQQLGDISVIDSLDISENFTDGGQLGKISISDNLYISEDLTITNTQLGDIPIFENLDLSETVSTEQINNINVFDVIITTEDIKTESFLFAPSPGGSKPKGKIRKIDTLASAGKGSYQKPVGRINWDS